MSDEEVHGPVDVVLIEFPGRPGDEVTTALTDLLDSGVVRLWDLVVIHKDEDGTFSGLVLDDEGTVGSLVAFAGARSGMLGDDDLAAAGEAMAPGSTAALIMYENTWAIPFVAAARRAGGEMVASMRISAQDIMETLDALEALED